MFHLDFQHFQWIFDSGKAYTTEVFYPTFIVFSIARQKIVFV